MFYDSLWFCRRLTWTFIQFIGLDDVSYTQTLPLTDLWYICCKRLWDQSIQVTRLRKRVSSVMHNAREIILLSKRVDLGQGHLCKIIVMIYKHTKNIISLRFKSWKRSTKKRGFHERLTFFDIFAQNLYIVISVWPSVFVPKANHVTQFMNNDAKLITILSDGNGLGSS